MLATLDPTSEQLEVIRLVRETKDNLLINALAGTGKTTTLEMIVAAAKESLILCLAFNKKIAEEMTKRFPSICLVRTFNSLGHRIWAKTCVKNLKLDPKKVQTILGEMLKTMKKEDRREASEAYWDIIHGVGYAKAVGYIPEGKFPSAKRLLERAPFFSSLEERPTVFIASIIDEVLTESIKQAYDGLIDFNDQIYMPALFGGTFPRFPLVLVDEAQDLSPTNHALLHKLCRGRVIAVGDPWQSIYGFRGALQGGMGQLQSHFTMHETTLSISFRCPQRVVEEARWRVPSFKWTNIGGTVDHFARLRPDDICDDGVAIICRNNAPLFRCAFSLLSRGRSVSVAGSDIGPRVVGTMRKLADASATRSDTLSHIQSWLDQKRDKGSTTADDMAACMVIFAEHGETLGQAIAYAEHLFAQRGSIRLLTGHKAKGLEFDTVYFLDPWLLGDDEQELNLRYVIQTRTKRELYYINSKDITW
jgi:DNA helicase-2/ATP-dependent DNA helicase PcrA